MCWKENQTLADDDGNKSAREKSFVDLEEEILVVVGGVECTSWPDS